MTHRQFDLRADAALLRVGLAALVMLGWLVIAANGQEKLQPVASNDVLERSIQGNVRFFGENLRAAGKVAHKAAKILARSTLPEPSTPAVAQEASGTNGNDSSKSSAALQQSAIK